MAFVSGKASRFQNTRVALEKMGELYVSQLTKNLIQLDKVATKKLIRTLDYRVVERISGEFEIIILAQKYLKWVDGGRKAGRRPPVAPFEEWVRAKGLRFRDKKGRFISYKQTAFIIRNSLTSKTYGGKGKNIRPTNVIRQTIGDILKKKQIISEGYKGDVLDLIRSTIITTGGGL